MVLAPKIKTLFDYRVIISVLRIVIGTEIWFFGYVYNSSNVSWCKQVLKTL